jgi:hypothetical protein
VIHFRDVHQPPLLQNESKIEILAFLHHVALIQNVESFKILPFAHANLICLVFHQTADLNALLTQTVHQIWLA